MGVTGREVKAAFAKFGTNSWGVAASVTKGIYLSADGGARFAPQRVNDEAFGQTFYGRGDFGDTAPQDITLTTRDRYADHQYVLEALAMGSPAAPTISSSATGQTTSWKHVIDLSASADGLGATFAFDKVQFVDEITAAKIYGFNKTVGDSGVMETTFRVMGNRMTDISSVNVAATVAGANYPGLDNRVFRKQGTYRMNIQSAGSLAATNAIALEGITFEFERPQDAPNVTGQDYIAEPGDNGFPTMRLTITYPRMNTVSANSLYAALRNDTAFKADLTFEGSYINSTDRYTEKIEFPALELDTDGFTANVSGADQVKPQAIFLAKAAATSPTGMAFVNPFRMTRITTQSLAAF